MVLYPTSTIVDSQTDIDASGDSGLEAERENPQERIAHPFNPEQIRIRTVPILVEQLISRISHEEIDLAPDFQRQLGI